MLRIHVFLLAAALGACSREVSVVRVATPCAVKNADGKPEELAFDLRHQVRVQWPFRGETATLTRERGGTVPLACVAEQLPATEQRRVIARETWITDGPDEQAKTTRLLEAGTSLDVVPSSSPFLLVAVNGKPLGYVHSVEVGSREPRVEEYARFIETFGPKESRTQDVLLEAYPRFQSDPAFRKVTTDFVRASAARSTNSIHHFLSARSVEEIEELGVLDVACQVLARLGSYPFLNNIRPKCLEGLALADLLGPGLKPYEKGRLCPVDELPPRNSGSFVGVASYCVDKKKAVTIRIDDRKQMVELPAFRLEGNAQPLGILSVGFGACVEISTRDPKTKLATLWLHCLPPPAKDAMAAAPVRVRIARATGCQPAACSEEETAEHQGSGEILQEGFGGVLCLYDGSIDDAPAGRIALRFIPGRIERIEPPQDCDKGSDWLSTSLLPMNSSRD